MRVTHGMLADTTLRNLSANMLRLEKLQDQLTSGRRISKPSDDPIGVARALIYRTTLAETGQFLRNIDAATSWLNATDAALDSQTYLLQRARELAIRGATGSLSSEDRAAIAEEVRQIREQSIQVGNSTIGNDYLFAGQRITSPAFAADGTYTGDSGLIEREVGFGARLAINVPGDTVFSAAFAALQDLVDGLVADDTAGINASLGAIDAALDDILVARSQIGARANRLETAAARLADLEVNQTGLLSKEEDLEMAEAIMNYTVADNVYKAALAAGARAIQPSLLDYLR